jgi:hypothetical protein
MTLKDSILKAAEFDDKRDVNIVKDQEKNAAEFFKDTTEWTEYGSHKDCYEYGFYAGAKWQRDQRCPLLLALADACEALNRLGGESAGMLKAHEMAVRMDAGNTNFECYMLSVNQAREALQKVRELVKHAT